ncbi:DUF6778 family protein [Roseicyclus mahoneyensis]|jgi:hypothetical protein|uniref:Lipoprotein n=1 Tax=Roseicyclus mahoneyensis TaxID=164332 RepID=A0A316GM16_9RHOB|nr:DUF6778 family protein [Roseicyclus mahoneyensis]PWK62055.1 hypothetical protein C7455_10180 [Roseicyclus mahoneyensis]
MKRIFTTPALIVAALLGLSACGTPLDVMRNASISTIAPVIDAPTQDWSITAVEIDVPRTLTVSEANSIKPVADIVWRGDPPGDRYDQIETLMTQALGPVLRPREGASTPVVVSLEVTRFHAVTERARYTVGGEHEIEFVLTVRHAETGEILSGPRDVDLTFRAYGGRQAIEAEAQGITQTVRITARLQEWARIEFPTPYFDLLTVAQVQN